MLGLSTHRKPSRKGRYVRRVRSSAYLSSAAALILLAVSASPSAAQISSQGPIENPVVNLNLTDRAFQSTSFMRSQTSRSQLLICL